jgi:DNA-binding NarL/FixJ family response regulator|tara:strand:- start:11874 stop:12491 length:618 start_codon:yes stop_codon:yes gene_type:complete
MRILIADDHELLRDTLSMCFVNESDIEVTTVLNVEETLQSIDENGLFDLIILDYKMPGMKGLIGLKEVISYKKNQKVALISGIANREIALEAIECGAAGFLPKNISAKSFISAVKFMIMGEKYIPINFQDLDKSDTIKHDLLSNLTEREIEIWKGISEGKTNQELGTELKLAIPTVKFYARALYKKIKMDNRVKAALFAKQNKIF